MSTSQLPPGVNCPSPFGPDFDFASGSGPNLLHLSDDDGDRPHRRGRHGANQQGESVSILSASHRRAEFIGRSIRTTARSSGGHRRPPAALRGASNGGLRLTGPAFTWRYQTLYAHDVHAYANGGPTIDWGSWAALDPRTGKILWQVPDPTPGTVDPGAVSVANGVFYTRGVSTPERVTGSTREWNYPFHLRQRWLGHRRSVHCGEPAPCIGAPDTATFRLVSATIRCSPSPFR